MTNPIWVVKTRMCLQYSVDTNLPSCKKYNSMIDALVKVFKHEGIPGMYKVCDLHFQSSEAIDIAYTKLLYE